MMDHSNENDTLSRIKRWVLADRTRAALLGVVLLVGLALVVHVFSGGPARAQAKPRRIAKPAAPRAIRLDLAPLAVRPDTHAVNRTIRRDPFQTNYAAYPLTAAEAQRRKAMLRAADSQDVSRHQAAEDAQALETVQHIRALAEALTLQSTVVADPPSAIINQKVLPVGGAIAGFKVVHIGQGTCVVEQDGVKVTLKME